MITFILLLLLVVVVGGGLVWGWWRTSKIQNSPEQALFLAGEANVEGLTGLWRGRVPGRTFTWQGKKFLDTERGINVFDRTGTVTEEYPFRYSVAPSIRDRGLTIVKLDYNQPGNPWWLRFIVDEMVAIDPNHYLGKVHIRLLPGVSFAMGYFYLER